jgi:hypothetical protein
MPQPAEGQITDINLIAPAYVSRKLWSAGIEMVDGVGTTDAEH